MTVVVVIPAYNASSVITACLASVSGQTSVPDEVVVVDDGSTDETAELAREWDGRLNLTVEQQANSGPASARRRGLEVTNGKLIALLDADDVWLPDHLELLMAVHRRHGGLVTANALRWRPGSDTPMVRHGRRLPVPPPARQRAEILRRNFVFVSSLFARDDYDQVPGFRDGWSGVEDWDLWIQLIRSGITVRMLEAPTCLYRLGNGSLTSSLGIYQRYVDMLSHTREELDSEDERAIVDRSIARYHARMQLNRGADATRSGHYREARMQALGAIRGDPAVAAQALGMVISPRRALDVQSLLTRRRWG